MITITLGDLPFLRFVKRHQLAASCLRRISEHPLISQLECGVSHQVEFEFEASEKELASLESLSFWWDKAEYQGISTRLLAKLGKTKAETEVFAA